jgi:hypothetical protein
MVIINCGDTRVDDIDDTFPRLRFKSFTKTEVSDVTNDAEMYLPRGLSLSPLAMVIMNLSRGPIRESCYNHDHHASLDNA